MANDCPKFFEALDQCRSDERFLQIYWCAAVIRDLEIYHAVCFHHLQRDLRQKTGSVVWLKRVWQWPVSLSADFNLL